MSQMEDEEFVYRSSITEPQPYIPKSLSELYDQIGSMILHSSDFKKKTGYVPETLLESDFFELDCGLELLRDKLGESSYAKAVDLSARAKALFQSDPDMVNGQAEEGILLLDEIDQLINAVRRYRYENGVKDEFGKVSGD